MPKCTTKAKKPLIYKDFRLIFNDKKKTVGRYNCINLLLLIWQGQKGSNPRPTVLETGTLPTELYPYFAPIRCATLVLYHIFFIIARAFCKKV